MTCFPSSPFPPQAVRKDKSERKGDRIKNHNFLSPSLLTYIAENEGRKKGKLASNLVLVERLQCKGGRGEKEVHA